MSKKRKPRQKRKSTSQGGFTRDDAKKVFDREKIVDDSIVNTLYTQILGTAHQSTKDIVENYMLNAIQTGFNLKDGLGNIEQNPELKKDFMSMVQQAAQDMEKTKTATDILREEVLKDQAKNTKEETE